MSDSEYFKTIKSYSTRTMEDKECVRIILNILQMEHDRYFRTLVDEKSELAARKAKYECKADAYHENDPMGWGPGTPDYSYQEKSIETCEKNIRSIKELILFVQERLTYEVPPNQTSS